MTDYKVNFKDLKAKVGIDDVAYALGYRLDRKAGVGRYMELVLGDGKEKRDALVICLPRTRLPSGSSAATVPRGMWSHSSGRT